LPKSPHQFKTLFITFEGGEGAGKTTLIESIAKECERQGRQVLKTREPGGTPLGERVRSLLLENKGPISPFAELALFLASRAEQIAEKILPALDEGKIVLCDRFNDSSIAYQGCARGLGMEEVESFCRFISGGLDPTLTLYLDIDPKEGLMRAQKSRALDRIEAEDIAFHTKIREGYLAIHRKHPERFHLLDASKRPDAIFQESMRLIRQALV
jgi:dTMP kinase